MGIRLGCGLEFLAPLNSMRKEAHFMSDGAHSLLREQQVDTESAEPPPLASSSAFGR